MAFFKEKTVAMKNVFTKKLFNMKTIKLFLFSIILFMAIPVLHSQTLDVPNGIISALDEGNSSVLSGYLNANVELVIGAQNDVFSKQQATGIIADFFRKNRVVGFELLHKGNKDAASFAIGTLKTGSGSYRVYVLTRKNEIQQLRIEPSND
jgi:hypothetical protein